MPNPAITRSSRRRWVRRLSTAMVIAVIAAVTVGLARSEVGWGLVPGRIGAPATTIVLPPPATTDATARLAVLGDVGTGDESEWATAGLVARAAHGDPFDALILLGDNVYPDGNPERLNDTVFAPFDPILDQGTPLIGVLGNHDIVGGNGAGQVAALGMPGRWYATEIGSALIVVLDSNAVDDEEQQQWLEATLADAPSPFVVVAMHHPAYSAGYHGPTAEIQEAWVPLFERYDVDLVLAGHDHDYQRMIPIDGVTYIVTGAGSKTRPADSNELTAFAASVLHYLDIQIWDSHIAVTAHSADGPFDHVIIDRH